MEKLEYKKTYKHLYLPTTKPAILEIPPINFALIEGQGDPNKDEFAQATAALYSFSYTVRMSYKGSNVPIGYYDYTVFPLEGVWDLIDKKKPSTDKSNFAYTIMIRQPDFVDNEIFLEFLSQAKRKKPNPYLDKLKFKTISEGLCCQILHLGSYDDEPASFNKMDQYCHENGFLRSSLKHREIYLSDPRKTEASKLKTVLRYKIERMDLP